MTSGVTFPFAQPDSLSFVANSEAAHKRRTNVAHNEAPSMGVF
jgi:hypothetical protein